MTQDEIIDMAVQAKLYSGNPRTPSTGRMIEKRLEAFAKIVAEREREACAKVCDDIDDECEGEAVSATWCSKAIRARGNS